MTHLNHKSTIVIKGTFTLLLALLVVPTAIAAASTTGSTVSSSISQVISLLSSSGTVNIDAVPTAGGVQTIASDTVTVSTNDSAGYTLKLGETSASGALVSGGNSIAAVTATQASPVAETANSWGYRVDSIGGFGAGTGAATNAAISSEKFAPVPVTASPDTLKTTSATASNDVTTVWYGIAVNTTAPAGTYTNSVTYTAVAN